MRETTGYFDENEQDELPTGILAKYADSSKRELEEGAFERAMMILILKEEHLCYYRINNYK